MKYRLTTVLLTLTTAAIASIAAAQHAGHGSHEPSPPASTAPTPPASKPPTPISMEELHRHGGVPRGWKFTLPAGDPKAGHEVFSKLDCAKCHEIKPDFTRGERAAGDVGPELTGMGAHHPAEYFAQSIVDPNAVIVAGPGFTGPDGRSVMPDYRDSLTVTELVDLVAYLRSLGGGEDHGGHQHGGHQHGAAPAREQTAGPYRVRVAYHEGDDAHAHHHGGGHGAMKPAPAHLMVFVTDAESGEPIPYLPVTAMIRAGSAAPRSIRLAPMLGGQGFHYGADVTLPEETSTVTVSLGAAGVKTMGASADRFRKPVTVRFEWSD
jgi:mono/diheme cytochrome c family protein